MAPPPRTIARRDMFQKRYLSTRPCPKGKQTVKGHSSSRGNNPLKSNQGSRQIYHVEMWSCTSLALCSIRHIPKAHWGFCVRCKERHFAQQPGKGSRPPICAVSGRHDARSKNRKMTLQNGAFQSCPCFVEIIVSSGRLRTMRNCHVVETFLIIKTQGWTQMINTIRELLCVARLHRHCASNGAIDLPSLCSASG